MDRSSLITVPRDSAGNIMAKSHDDGHDDSERGEDLLKGVTPRPYSETRMVVRVRPQYDPVKLAASYLDDMEKQNRLHFLNREG